MFSTRATTPELLDDPSLDELELHQTFRQLEFLNRVSGAYRPTLDAVTELATHRDAADEPLRIVDIGSGRGDLLRRVHRWAEGESIAVECIGVDLNPMAASAAASVTSADAPIRFVTADVMQYAPDHAVDIVINSLFAHHLSNAELTRVMAWMCEHSRIGWHINDLHRHRVSYWLLRILLPVLRFNRLIRHDGPVSVQRGFSRDDWGTLLAGAGVNERDVRVRRYFPFRWSVLWVRP